MLGDHKLMIGSVIDQIQREALSIDLPWYSCLYTRKHSNDLIRISELSTESFYLRLDRSSSIYLF